MLLTLIVLGKVKFELADIDVKFLTYSYILCNGLKIPVPAETSCNSFWTSYRKMRFNVHFEELHLKTGYSTTPPSPPARFYCSFRPCKGRRTANTMWSAIRHCASQHSKHIPVLRRTECGVWRTLSWSALWSMVNGGALFGPMHETVAVYCLPSH